MYGTVVVFLCFSLWLLVLVPTVSAETVCRKNWRGQVVCKTQQPVRVKVGIAIAIILCVLVGLIVGLIFFVRRNRAQARMTEPDMCQVEESQVQGPHVIRETEYTPASASGPVGEAGSRSAAVEPTFPRPEPAMYAEHSRYEGPRTAPATRVRFTEDLGEEGANGGRESTLEVPRTAFVNRGFPRPLYTSLPREQRGEWYR